MKRSLVTSGLLGAFALAISAAAALAQPSNLGGSQREPPLSEVRSPLVLVRGGGGGAVTASAAATGVVLAEAMVFMAVISGAASALLTARTTTTIMVTRGARGAHAITDGSAIDEHSAAPQGHSRPLGRSHNLLNWIRDL